MPDEARSGDGADESAEEASGRLLDATEELNEEIDRIEEALHSLHLGVTAEVLLYTSGGGQQVLGFGKTGNGWVLFVKMHGEAEHRTLRSCSRAHRVQAMSRLDDLLDKMMAVNRAHADGVVAAIEKAREFRQRLAKMSAD